MLDRTDWLPRVNAFATSLLLEQSLDGLLWAIADNIGGVLGYEDCVIYLVEKNVCVQAAAFGEKRTDDKSIFQPIEIPVGEGIVGTVAATGVAEVVGDTSTDPRYIADQFAGRSEITVPILYQGRVIGILDSESVSPKAYDSGDLEFLQFLANISSSRIASALEERDRLTAQKQLRRANEQLEDRVRLRTQELEVSLAKAVAAGRELRAAEDALRAERNRSRSIVETALDAVVVMDGLGIIRGWNAQAEQIFGWPESEALGQDMSALIVPESYRSAHRAGLDLYMSDRIGPALGRRLELTAVRRDGTEFPIELSISAISDGDDPKDVIFSGFVRDLTTQRDAERAVNEARAREVALGANIQDLFLRGRLPTSTPGLDIHYVSNPSRELDGDFVDFLWQRGEAIDVVVGDVMGKGTAAALLGAAVKSQISRTLISIRNAGEDTPSVAAVVQQLHEEVAAKLLDLESFVTLLYTRVDVAENTLHFVDCGHPRMIHHRPADGTLALLEGDDLPIGVVASHQYRERCVRLLPGDFVVLYSDGVIEAASDSGELFGIERLKSAVRDSNADSSAALCDRIWASHEAHRGGGPLTDDYTLVVVRVAGDMSPVVDSGGKEVEIEIGRSFEALAMVRNEIAGFCSDPATAAPQEFVYELQLGAQEALTNVIKHSRPADPKAAITIVLSREPTEVRIRIMYAGEPFDAPEAVAGPRDDILPTHGFGLSFIEACVDRVRYRSLDHGMNEIILRKTLA